ncbi:hypothetical protein LTR67_004720 [Exophiala xenobiotica]
MAVKARIANLTSPGRSMCQLSGQRRSDEIRRLEYVVNAAGIAMKHQGRAAFAASGGLTRILDVNLTGTFFVLRAAARSMLKQDPVLSSIDGRPLQCGSIVTFGSIQTAVGIPLPTTYTA